MACAGGVTKVSMTDTIYINDLTLRCTIGAFEPERKTKQPVVITVAMRVDLTIPSRSDVLADTVSYSAIYHQIIDLVVGSEFFLLEALAGAIASVCLKNDQVLQVKVHVEKPNVLPLAKSAAVEIVRSK